MTNEEIVLAIQTDKGDKNKLLTELYEQNRGLIAKVARRYMNRADFDDCMQEGYLGLYRAAELYNPEAGSFSAYAISWIHARINYFVYSNMSSVSIPAGRVHLISKLQKLTSAAELEGRKPSDYELIEALRLSGPDELKQLRADAFSMNCRSLDAPLTAEDDSITLSDTIADPSEWYEVIENDVFVDELGETLWPMVDQLPENTGRVIRETYQDNRTAGDIAEEMGTTADDVRCMRAAGLRGLRRGNNLRLLRPFLDASRAYSLGLLGTSLGAFRNSGSSSTERAAIKGYEIDEKVLNHELRKVEQRALSASDALHNITNGKIIG